MKNGTIPPRRDKSLVRSNLARKSTVLCTHVPDLVYLVLMLQEFFEIHIPNKAFLFMELFHGYRLKFPKRRRNSAVSTLGSGPCCISLHGYKCDSTFPNSFLILGYSQLIRSLHASSPGICLVLKKSQSERKNFFYK